MPIGHRVVRVAAPRDQSGLQHAGDGTKTEHELGAAAARLREERDEVRSRLETMSRDMEDLIAASADSNADDEHDPEGQTIAYERSQLAALIQGAEEHLAGIEAGMIRLKEGSYGICEVCHQPIPAARLEARPTAQTCIQHTTPTRA